RAKHALDVAQALLPTVGRDLELEVAQAVEPLEAQERSQALRSAADGHAGVAGDAQRAGSPEAGKPEPGGGLAGAAVKGASGQVDQRELDGGARGVNDAAFDQGRKLLGEFERRGE